MAAFDTEDTVATFAARARLGKESRYRVASEIKKISKRLDLIDKDRTEYNLVVSGNDGGFHSHSQSQNHLPVTSSFVDTTGVFGRDSGKQILIDQMLTNESDASQGDVSVIPIIGMGGLGKTTLAQLIFNDEGVKNHFEYRMWFCVNNDLNLERVLKGNIEFHTEKEIYNWSFDDLVSQFKNNLAGKNFLLVLDNVYNPNYQDWETLGNILKQGGKGSRVLVTSQSNRVSEMMGTRPPYALEYLPQEECWSLFKKIAFKDCNSPSTDRVVELEAIGRKIVRKCNGLPLAVKAMGGLLRGNVDVDKWRRILRDSIWELEDSKNLDTPKILPALKLSYDYLPSYLKQCYSYCSIFPKAYVFDRKELVKLWMAEAFIQPRGQNSAEETGGEYFDELLTRFFFQKLNMYNDGRYKMHDLIHDLAVSVSSPLCCQVEDDKSPTLSRKTRHVSLLCRDLECPKCKQVFQTCNKMRTLLLPTNYSKSIGKEALGKLFRSLKYIRVLDLSSTSLSELPSSVEELVLLRSLDLSKTEIKKLPNSVCNLWNLERLKLLECLWLFELPKDMGKMVNLIYLELDDMFWFKCSKLPPNLGKLTKLKNLHAFRVLRGKAGHTISELKDMTNLTGKLHIFNLENTVNAAEAKLDEKKSLENLVLEWNYIDDNQEDEARAANDLNDLRPHSDLKEMAIHRFKGSNFPLWMTTGFLHKLQKLTLKHCSKFTTISFAQLPCLGELRIKGMPELEEWRDYQCLTLEKLIISDCPKLKKVPDSMRNLRSLKVKRCDSLKALPVASYLRFLTLADNPALENWGEALIVMVKGQDVCRSTSISVLEFKLKNGSNIQARPRMFGPNLPVTRHSQRRRFKLKNGPNIQARPQMFAPWELEIRECEDVTALPVTRLSQRRQSLALETYPNDSLVRQISSAGSLYSMVISDGWSPTSFSDLPRLPGFKSVSISDCEDFYSSPEEYSLQSRSTLELLSIGGCPKLNHFLMISHPIWNTQHVSHVPQCPYYIQ